MTLIKSISGIRGTIGGAPGDTLNPLDIVKFTTAYATLIRRNTPNGSRKIVVGRDARLSGEMVSHVVCGTLMGMGFDVIDIGLATTPTTELAVTMAGADGGIIITASHNPCQWNALKLLNAQGEFFSAADGAELLEIAGREEFDYADVEHLGSLIHDDSFTDRHVEKVLSLPAVDAEKVRHAGFRVCVDTINSVGAIALPPLFKALGVEFQLLNEEPNGRFAHNPEPLEKHLGQIMEEMKGGQYDLGIVVDPDVDRLAFICEDGKMFGEEYTLVSVADYVLSRTPGATVSNLSSSRALSDVAARHNCSYTAAAVGEVNVTTTMKAVGAVIGGEGNGGVIYPPCHYGRDALVGIALFLSSLAEKGCRVSELRASLPTYFMAKHRVDLTADTDIDALLNRVQTHYNDQRITLIDGVKIDFADSWVHLRRSNTEPIIRIYSEAPTMEAAEALAKEVAQLMV